MRPPIVHHAAYVARLPPSHRFPMSKYSALMRHLRAHDLARPEQCFEPEPAPRSWLELAHDPAYVGAILEQRLPPAAERRLGFPLTPELALRSRSATAGTLLAARLALEHGLALNTAGGSHHAFPAFGSGFCVFNDVAVATTMLLVEHSVERVLVVDLDVHQGDGTAAFFANEPRVRAISVHCRTNFPARKQQSSLDVALDVGTTDEPYLATLAEILPLILEDFRPDLVFYNAGVDPHEGDRLGRLALTTAGLAARDRYVLSTCRAAGVPVACVIGGGYGPDIEEVAARHAILFQVAHEPCS